MQTSKKRPNILLESVTQRRTETSSTPSANKSLMRLEDFKQGSDSALLPQRWMYYRRDELSVLYMPPSSTRCFHTFKAPHSHSWPSSFFIDKILEDRFFPQPPLLPSTKCRWCRSSTAIKLCTQCLFDSDEFKQKMCLSPPIHYLPLKTCFCMGKLRIHSPCLVLLPIFSFRDLLTAHI